MKVVNFSEARNHLKRVLDQVVDDADDAVITRRDADDAVVMSRDQFNGLMETVHLLKSPAISSWKKLRNMDCLTIDLLAWTKEA